MLLLKCIVGNNNQNRQAYVTFDALLYLCVSVMRSKIFRAAIFHKLSNVMHHALEQE